MPRARVLTLTDHLDGRGGAEVLVRSIVTRLDPERFDVTLCGAPGPPDAATLHACRAAGVRVIGVRSWRALGAVLRARRVDVLHTHKYRQNAWGAVIGRLAGVPAIVAHEHTWHYGYWPERLLVDREVVGRLADAFVAVSPADARRMVEVEGIAPAKVRHIPNGIAPLPAPSGRDVRAELGIAPGARVVGALTRLHPQKRLDVLLHAAAGRDVCVLLAGEGDERGALEALAARLGVRAVFAGRRADVADVLAALDVVVCCSDFEGSPLAVMEAMQAGRPVVATAVGGVPDLVGADAGVLVAPGDPGALAAALDGVLADAALRARLGRAAARRAEAFGIDATVRAVEALYDELLGRTQEKSLGVPGTSNVTNGWSA